jgi:hypothetical protein
MVDQKHIDDRQMMMGEMQLRLENVKPYIRYRMLKSILSTWVYIEKVESDGGFVSNDKVMKMVQLVRDRDAEVGHWNTYGLSN